MIWLIQTYAPSEITHVLIIMKTLFYSRIYKSLNIFTAKGSYIIGNIIMFHSDFPTEETTLPARIYITLKCIKLYLTHLRLSKNNCENDLHKYSLFWPSIHLLLLRISYANYCSYTQSNKTLYNRVLFGTNLIFSQKHRNHPCEHLIMKIRYINLHGTKYNIHCN